MQLAINGRFLLQPVTGVQKVAIECIKQLDELLVGHANISAILYVPAKGELTTNILPLKAIKFVRKGRFSGHVWEQCELPLWANQCVLLNLGNTAPIKSLLSKQTKTITMVHDLSYKYFPLAYSVGFRCVYHCLIPIVLRFSTRVVTVSQSEKKAILKNYGHCINDDRLGFLQNGGLSGDPVVNDVSSESTREQKVLYVGSLTKRKNAEGLIRAALILAEDPSLEFVFVGSNGLNFAGVDIDIPPALAGRFHFLGQINDPDLVSKHYQTAKMLLFPSFYEASPLPPIEAMANGCPVVAASIPSLLERCGEAAEYCAPHDVNSIVTAAKNVLYDTDKWQELQLKGYHHAGQFTWRAQAQALLSGIESLANTDKH